MGVKPWAEGPLELLKHAIQHLSLASEFDNRIAMISVDNAVELMIRTYLNLPGRISGIKGPSRRELSEISQSFPSLLDAMEKFAPNKVIGIELGDIEYYHRIRNQLYHDGNGVTVSKGRVQAYSEIGKNLFSLCSQHSLTVSSKRSRLRSWVPSFASGRSLSTP